MITASRRLAPPWRVSRRTGSRLLAMLLATALTGVASAQQDVRLPDLGSSANALISPQEAQAYGAAMLHQMRALDMVLEQKKL